MEALDIIFQQYQKNPRVTTDTRQITTGDIFIALKGGNFDGNNFAKKALEMGAALAVVDDRSIEGDGIVYVENGLFALQELARMYRRTLKIPFIGLTGTNGKTTTKELIVAVLSSKYKVAATKGNLNNQIGVPLTILSIPSDAQVAVIELGANHPLDIDELTSIAMPDLGLITNVGMAHLEGFGSFEGVKRTKGELYDFINSVNGTIFLNTDNSYLVQMAQERKVASTVAYGMSKMGVEILTKDIDHPFLRMRVDKGEMEGITLETQLVGDYNADNVLAAVTIGLHFRISVDHIKKALNEYTPTNNRSQLMRTSKNLVIVDCYNANPTSMEAAISNFTKFNVGSKIAILGDMLELGEASASEHVKIVNLAEQLGVENLLLVGPEFVSVAGSTSAILFTNSNELIEYLKANPIENSLVLVKGSRGIKLENALSLL
ncbi:UDP-N-acetylmuramoyl-tripeptide--D-alanyl-D-alanine ligase [uncultured Acetobacteroides sp.]|uniref:UDP-N-acetylmuramoyl-tripeptide--D-alanyl-D- alanine ligase n=1 Tax=uncultured Acetobacteroides sp. TaxID=1760811 RepID=UPI0029F4A5F3|nr:UDP-N-acetylmuramoyl-tripeptide--D-alanyl-D-alanine ligase [uncultured Acetobacteroides sp.]